MKIKGKPGEFDRVKLEYSCDEGESWSHLPPDEFEKRTLFFKSDDLGWWLYRVIFEEGKGFTYEVFEDFELAIAYYVAKCAKPTETKISRVEKKPEAFLLNAIKQLGELPADPSSLLLPLLKLGYTQKDLNEALEYINEHQTN